MRLVNGDVNVYYLHDTLTFGNIRAASYGNAASSGVLVPEVGDILHGFPGWTGSEYEAITVRVTEVKTIGNGVEAYAVHTTSVPSRPEALTANADREIAQLTRIAMDTELTPTERAKALLTVHQRKDAGSCLCGWAELGQSHAGHQADELARAGLFAADSFQEDGPYLAEHPGECPFPDDSCRSLPTCPAGTEEG